VSPDPYSERVRSLFGHPAHAGALEQAPQVLIEDQGVRVALAALVEGQRILELRFRAYGCPHVIAAAEALCERYEGRPVKELEAFEAAQLVRDLPVPAEKTGRILVIEDAARALGKTLRNASTPESAKD
jgi:NifU-like protein involved in Fe-S cluster formation